MNKAFREIVSPISLNIAACGIAPESTWLSRFKANVATTAGEDGIIEKICEVVGTENKLCIVLR